MGRAGREDLALTDHGAAGSLGLTLSGDRLVPTTWGLVTRCSLLRQDAEV